MSAALRYWRLRLRWPRPSARWSACWPPTGSPGPRPRPQRRAELAALKLSIDSATRNVAAQLTRIGERIDRVERAQAEPVAKLNKAIDVLERLSRGEAAPVPKDVTGAILPPVGLATQGGKAGAVEGWVVRDVHRGTALLEGRMGLIEVDPGDVVPGLGRVDAIRKQDGRWVVVTPKGLIMPPR